MSGFKEKLKVSEFVKVGVINKKDKKKKSLTEESNKEEVQNGDKETNG